MIFGFLAMTIGNLIEVIYIGQVGKFALAAYTFTFPIAMCLNALTRGIGVGASAIVARQMGEQNENGAGQTATFALCLVLLFTISMAIIGQFAAGAVFVFLGAADETLTLAVDYASIWLIGFPMMGIAMVSNGLIRAFGDATFPGYVMTTGPVVQVLLGPFLIFGWFGLPAMGLNGAGWAVVIANSAQVVIAAYWFLVKHRRLTFNLSGFVRSSRSILYVGIPAAATNVIPPFSFVVLTWLLADFGSGVVAAFGVAARLEAVVSMVAVGISTAVVPMVGQNWGAGHFSRVRETMRTCYFLSHMSGLLAAFVMLLFAPLLVSLVNDDESLVEAAVLYLYVIPASIGFMGMIIIATNGFNAIRKPAPALILSVARLVVVFIPLALVLKSALGYLGVFVAIALSNVIVGLVSWYWCRRVMKNEQRIYKEQKKV